MCISIDVIHHVAYYTGQWRNRDGRQFNIHWSCYRYQRQCNNRHSKWNWIARSAYYKLRKIWASNLYSRNIKKKIYKINLISALLHWIECWNIRKRNGEIYNTFNTSNWKIVRIFGQLYFPTQNCCKEPICAALPTLIRPGDRVR